MSEKQQKWIGLLILAFVAWKVMGGSVSPKVDGPLTVLIVRETGQSSPALARTLTTLRNGEPAAYLAGKKHILTVLDDDAETADGQPAPLLEKFKPYPVLPELLLISGEKLIHREPLPATPEAVIALVKKHGGE